MSASRGRLSLSSGWKLALATGAATVALGSAGVAKAYDAVVTASAPLEAGPSPDYPQVAELDSGAPVTVYGCIGGYEWCDVSFQGNRGWFDGQLLAVPYQGQQVPIFDYGVAIGLPVITFSFNSYWNHYYHGRPFFAERGRYANIPAPPPRSHDGRPGPGPGAHPGPRPGVARSEAPPAHPRPEAHPAPARPAPQARPPEHLPEHPVEHQAEHPAEHPEAHPEDHHE